MIAYSPINGEVLTSAITYYPQTAFVMTQLGTPVPDELTEIRKKLSEELLKYSFQEKDASSLVTGKDFLDKIWKLILGTQLGIGILTKDIPSKTIANIFYELGIMDALGKETIIIKSKDFDIPSDFKRTEYINYDNNFSKEFEKFQINLKERENHYWLMAELMQADPVLSLDYVKRAFLISPKAAYKSEAKRFFNEHIERIDEQSKLHIRNFLSTHP